MPTMDNNSALYYESRYYPSANPSSLSSSDTFDTPIGLPSPGNTPSRLLALAPSNYPPDKTVSYQSLPPGLHIYTSLSVVPITFPP